MSGLASLYLFLADDPLCSGLLVARKGRGLGILDLDVAGIGLRDQLGHVDVINRQIRKVDVVLGARCCISRNGERHVVNVAILGDVRTGGVVSTSDREGVRVERELECAEVSAGGRTVEGRPLVDLHLGDVAVEALVAGDGNRYLHGLARRCILVLTDIPNCVYLLGLLLERSGRGGSNGRGGRNGGRGRLGGRRRLGGRGRGGILDSDGARYGLRCELLLCEVADIQILDGDREYVTGLCSIRQGHIQVEDGRTVSCYDVVLLRIESAIDEVGVVELRGEAVSLGLVELRIVLIARRTERSLLDLEALEAVELEGEAVGAGVVVNGDSDERPLTELYLSITYGPGAIGLDRIALTGGEDDVRADGLDVERLLCEVADGQVRHADRDLVLLAGCLGLLCLLDVLIADHEVEGNDLVTVCEGLVLLAAGGCACEQGLIVVRLELGQLGGAGLRSVHIIEALLQALALCQYGHGPAIEIQAAVRAVGVDGEVVDVGILSEGIEIGDNVVLHIEAVALDLLLALGRCRRLRRGSRGRILGLGGRRGGRGGLLGLALCEDDGGTDHLDVRAANEGLLCEVTNDQVLHGDVDLVLLAGCLGLLGLLDVLIADHEVEGNDLVTVGEDFVLLAAGGCACEQGLIVVGLELCQLGSTGLGSVYLVKALLQAFALGSDSHGPAVKREIVTGALDIDGEIIYIRIGSECIQVIYNVSCMYQVPMVACATSVTD